MSLFFDPVPPALKPPTKLRERGETEMRRAIALSARLTDAQMSQLITWLEQHKVADVIRLAAAPPPIGFGILIHDTSLRRLKRKFRAGEITDRVQEMIDITSDIDAVTDSQDFETAQRGLPRGWRAHRIQADAGIRTRRPHILWKRRRDLGPDRR